MSNHQSDKIKSNGSNTAIYIVSSNGSPQAEEDLIQLAEICIKPNHPLELYSDQSLKSKEIENLIQNGKIKIINGVTFDENIKNVIPLKLPLANEPSLYLKWSQKANKVFVPNKVVVADGLLPQKAGFLQKYLHYISNFWGKLFSGVESNLSTCEAVLMPLDLFEKIVLKNKIKDAWHISALTEKEQLNTPVSFDLGPNDFVFGDGLKSAVKNKLLGFKLFWSSFFKVTNIKEESSAWTNINAPIYKKTFAVLCLTLLIGMAYTSKDYNVTWDEPAHNEFSKHVIKFYTSFGSDTTMFDPKISEFGKLSYGSSVDLVIRAVNNVFGFENEYYARHLIDSIIGFFLVLFTALLVRRLSGWLPAVITVIALFASPSLYGHFFNNSKDIPFATGYIMSIYYLVKLLQELPKPKHQTKVMLAIAIGFALSVRVGALLIFGYMVIFIGLYWLLFQFKKNANKSFKTHIKTIVVISISAYIFGIFFWPYALRQPLTGVFNALKQFEKFGLLTYYELFEGVRLYEKPWYYIPKMILITAPVGLLFGVFIGPIINWFKKDTLGKLILFLLIFSTVFPLAYAIYKKSYVYNGWRHFLFIYPTLTVLSVLAWHQIGLFFKNKTVRLVIWGVFIASLISPIAWNIKNHPYQYMYFNEIIGGIKGAHGNYDLDYWNQTPREAFEWLVKNKPEILGKDNNGNPKFKINANSNQEALKTFVEAGKDVPCLWTREMEWMNNNWDYAIWSTRTLSKNQILDGYWPPKGTIHVINVGGVPITAIVKAENHYGHKGNQYLKKNNGDSALYFYKLAYQYNPLEEEFARGVANAYKLKMQLDSALYFYNIAIKLKIGNYDALQSVGEVMYTQAMMKNPNSPDLNLLTKAYDNLSQAFKNKKNASAPLLMGEIKLLQNQNDLARNHFYSFLETYGNVGRGYLGLGKAQLRLNELDSAFMNLQYAIQLEPNNAEAYYYMGTELEKIGKKKEAEQFLNEYMKIINQK